MVSLVLLECFFFFKCRDLHCSSFSPFTLTLCLIASRFKKWKWGSFAYFGMQKIKQDWMVIVWNGEIQCTTMKMWWWYNFPGVHIPRGSFNKYCLFCFSFSHLFFTNVSTSVTSLPRNLFCIILPAKPTCYIMDVALFHNTSWFFYT